MTTLQQRAAPLLASAPYNKQRDTDSFSNDVYRHLSAMTSMDLRSKADIAQELAARDALLREALGEIERLNAALLPVPAGWPKRYDNPIPALNDPSKMQCLVCGADQGHGGLQCPRLAFTSGMAPQANVYLGTPQSPHFVTGLQVVAPVTSAFQGRRTARDNPDIPTDAGVPRRDDEWPDESRIDTIASNGPTGEHYSDDELTAKNAHEGLMATKGLIDG